MIATISSDNDNNVLDEAIVLKVVNQSFYAFISLIFFRIPFNLPTTMTAFVLFASYTIALVKLMIYFPYFYWVETQAKVQDKTRLLSKYLSIGQAVTNSAQLLVSV
jgi:hypothetical protein